MAQTLEQLESLINDVALELGKTLFSLKPGMFRIYYDSSLESLFKIKGGPLVEIYLGIGPNDKDFRYAIFDSLKQVKSLYKPMALVPYTLSKKDKKSKLKKERWEPEFKLDERRVRFTTKTITEVTATDRFTNISVTLKSSKINDIALKEEALIILSRRVESYYESQADGQ